MRIQFSAYCRILSPLPILSLSRVCFASFFRVVNRSSMLTTRFFKAIADGNPAAIASLLAPLAFGPAGFIVPIVTVASTLTADAAVAATRSVSAHRKRKADQGELDRKRRHELQMQRE